MYLIEWFAWLAATDSKEERDAFEKHNKTIKNRGVYENEEEELIEAAKKSASDSPKSRGPIYIYNEHVLEMRCGMWEDKRGLISILSLAIILSAVFNLWIAIGGIEKIIHLTSHGKPYGEQLFMSLFFLESL